MASPRTLVIALLSVGTLAAVSTAAGQGQPPSLAGTWKLNVAKSKFSPGPPPKSMRVTYTLSGDTVKIAVDVVPPDGAKQHWEMAGKYDGSDSKMTGNPQADTVSFKRIDATSSESTFKMAGKVVATNTRTLSADGKTLTIVSKGTTADGQPRHDVQVFER